MGKNTFTFTRRKFLQLACSTAAGSLLWGCQDKQSAFLDTKDNGITVFHNGTVLPVDAGFSEHQALAIHDNKIIAVASTESILALAGKDAKKILFQIVSIMEDKMKDNPDATDAEKRIEAAIKMVSEENFQAALDHAQEAIKTLSALNN